MTTDPTLLAAVLDFEAIFEKALAAVFADLQINAWTTQMVSSTGNADQDAALVKQGFIISKFQKDRPRVEIFFVPGAGQGRFIEFNVGSINGVPQLESVETCWKGTYRVDVITREDIRVHSAFRTQIRAVMLTVPTRLNFQYLTLHRLQHYAQDAGTSATVKPEEGYMLSTLTTDVDFSLQDGAWDTLLDP